MQHAISPFDQARPNRGGYRDLSAEQVLRAVGKARLIDVRESSELAADGFIQGAEHVPLATVDARAGAWKPDEEIVVICRSGNRSSRAAELLVRRGFRRVMNMVGGMLAYTAAGLPVARS